jgi:hypothetical protein
VVGRLGIGSVVAPSSVAETERRFAESMRNVTMIGTYTVAGREDRTPPSDRYDIASIEKIVEDPWRFNARFDCCGMRGAGAFPIVLPMRWVGDTPVIMVTNTSLPGLGTFTVLVFFYGDRYAGVWQHGGVGGHMSGRIQKRGSSPS